MRVLKQSTAYNLAIFMTDSSDHVSGKTGLTLTITASKDGAAFSSISPTVTELANGWYKIALTSSHTDTVGDLALHVTGTGADPTDLAMQVRANVLGDTLPGNVLQWSSANVASPDTAGYPVVTVKAGTGAGEINLANGFVPVSGVRFRKNTAFSNFTFLMVDATDGYTPKTGLSITAERSLDGGAFGSCANSASEISNGFYKINLAAGDLNGDFVTLRFSGTGARTRTISFPTQTA